MRGGLMMYYANGFIEYKGYLIEMEWDDGYRGIVHGIPDGYFWYDSKEYMLERMKQRIDEHEQTK